MSDDLKQRIREEIKLVEAEMSEQRHTLKDCEKLDLWEVQVKMRSLRVRLGELQLNLEALGGTESERQAN